MPKQRIIELLAPAKNADCAIEALLHGADAVYIGAPKFGARSAAGNSLDDIKRVVELAHQFLAKVYVTLNVIIYDSELAEVETLIGELWTIGVDALIVQDMGITRLNLPPIPLHASTQTDNRTVEKVRFLEDAGFKQVVLARELSLDQIREISNNTSVPLEFFVHGALCVSYSGQCYLSQAMCGRSANRGECAQWCRLPYDLEDADGMVLKHHKHLLSLKDLNLSAYLEDMIDAGITSFKIEGRLKDASYVKNITAFYRQQLDRIINRRPDLKRASLGVCRLGFVPDPSKSFNRGFTGYFINGRTGLMSNPDTPKSMGERLGLVKKVLRNCLVLDGHQPVANGDGLSFFDQFRILDGFRVNRVDGNLLYPAKMPPLKPGFLIYRTFDQTFERLLAKSSAERLIPVAMTCWETAAGFALEMKDEEGHLAVVTLEEQKIPAKVSQKQQLISNLTKLGNTRYEAVSCQINWSGDWFVPASKWADLRRQLCERMDLVLKLASRRQETVFPKTNHPYIQNRLTYLGNVSNHLAESFYREHGVELIDPALELTAEQARGFAPVVMFNKFCLRHELGVCPKQHKAASTLKEPLYLVHKDKRIQLAFDCNACEMHLTQVNG